MKGTLFLYSDQVIPENRQLDERLVETLSGENKSIAYVSSSPDPERYYFKQKRSYYKRIGLNLNSYFDEFDFLDTGPPTTWQNYDAIHLSGGNTYYFLSWITQCGLMEELINFVHDGGILVGTSAGAIIVTPDISTAELCGDVNSVEIESTNGFGLTDFFIWPHWNPLDDTSDLEKLNLRQNSKVHCVPDGSGIIAGAKKTEFVGEVFTHSI